MIRINQSILFTRTRAAIHITISNYNVLNVTIKGRNAFILNKKAKHRFLDRNFLSTHLIYVNIILAMIFTRLLGHFNTLT